MYWSAYSLWCFLMSLLEAFTIASSGKSEIGPTIEFCSLKTISPETSLMSFLGSPVRSNINSELLTFLETLGHIFTNHHIIYGKNNLPLNLFEDKLLQSVKKKSELKYRKLDLLSWVNITCIILNFIETRKSEHFNLQSSLDKIMAKHHRYFFRTSEKESIVNR